MWYPYGTTDAAVAVAVAVGVSFGVCYFLTMIDPRESYCCMLLACTLLTSILFVT